MRTIKDIGPRARNVLAEILQRHAAQDAELVEAVRQAGSDPSLPHQLRYYLYGVPEKLDAIRQFFASEGWRFEPLGGRDEEASLVPEAGAGAGAAESAAESEAAGGATRGMLVVTPWMTFTAEDVNRVTCKLVAAASLNECEFDGWETAVREKGDGLPEAIPAA